MGFPLKLADHEPRKIQKFGLPKGRHLVEFDGYSIDEGKKVPGSKMARLDFRAVDGDNKGRLQSSYAYVVSAGGDLTEGQIQWSEDQWYNLLTAMKVKPKDFPDLEAVLNKLKGRRLLVDVKVEIDTKNLDDDGNPRERSNIEQFLPVTEKSAPVEAETESADDSDDELDLDAL